MSLNLNYHHLLYFREVARSASFSKAAEILRIGQPALSSQIKKLEEQLGAGPLLKRGREGVSLTPIGSLILAQAEEIHQLGDMVVKLSHSPVQRKRHRVGFMESIPKSFITSVAIEAQRQGQESFLIEGEYSDLISKLLAAELDRVYCDSPPQRKAGLVYKKLHSFPIEACASKSFSKLKEGFPKSLSGQPMVMPTSANYLRAKLDSLFRKNSIKGDIWVETDDTAIQKSMAEEGLGVVFLSRPSAVHFLSRPDTISIGQLEGLYEEIWVMEQRGD